jgi:hypothetical protein
MALLKVGEWPTDEFRQEYDGYEFLLLPETERKPPAIALELGSDTALDTDKAIAAIRRFLSAYAWVTGHPIKDDFAIGAARPGGVGKTEGPVRTAKLWFRLDYLPSTQDSKTRLCLALYREALGVNNDAYRLLGFFKIVNALHKGNAAQKKWINLILPKLTDHQVREHLKELAKTENDLGKYLYESGRCAVAHAYSVRPVDPDNPADTRRLNSDLPVIQAIAEYLIEHELGIKSADTVRREHLYHLAGFRELLGADLVARLKRKEKVKVAELPVFPDFSVTVRNRLPYLRLTELSVESIEIEEGCVALNCRSKCGFFLMRLLLSFPDEGLDFDVQHGMAVVDDGSAHASLVAVDHHRLTSDLFLNGVLELVRNDTREALARSDPIVPVNMRYDGVAHERGQQRLQREYLERIATDARE